MIEDELKSKYEGKIVVYFDKILGISFRKVREAKFIELPGGGKEPVVFLNNDAGYTYLTDIFTWEFFDNGFKYAKELCEKCCQKCYKLKKDYYYEVGEDMLPYTEFCECKIEI